MDLIITANLGRMRAFRVKPSADPARENKVVEEIDTPPMTLAPHGISELTSDQAGRFNADGGPGMSHGEPHNLEREEERRLITQLAENIDSLLSTEKPGGWALALPSAINGRVMGAMNLKSLPVENRPQDLSKLPANEIGKRFGVLG